MGLIKENQKYEWLNKYNFVFVDNPVAGSIPGYENFYRHASNSECVWVTLCLPQRKVFLYNEFSCGGLLWERELDIPENINYEDEQSFIDWLDNELDIY